jgi:lysophospholipase L1-like esterase
VLSQLLSARYRTQSITMFNEGYSGESAEQGASRIGGALRSDNPDVLLLMQGVIDLGRGTPFISRVINALRDDITQARARGVREIFLGTLLPQKPHIAGFPGNEIAMPYIEEANTEIRALASQEGVNLVDLYAALAPNVETNIGGDGLHPTEEGFIAMAQTFFDAIKSKLEVTSPGGGAARTFTRSSSRSR